MNKYKATVVKTGNSLALRVPKQYAVDAQLQPGDKVVLPLPTKVKPQDHAKIIRLIGKLQELHAYSSIVDPAAWQRDIRQDRPLPGRNQAE
jgi:antitoxin component of MazEF toxin-antitoxin module